MRQAKGTILITIVKGIKANHQKRGEYERLLSDKAKELLNGRILAGSWYPLELYRELFDAICLVDARNDPKTLNKWGYAEGKRAFASVYQSSIIKDDLQTAVEKYSRHHKQLYNFGETVAEIISDNEMVVTWTDFIKEWENFYHMTVGWVMSFVELTVNRKVTYIYLNKSWKGGGWTKVRFTWFL